MLYDDKSPVVHTCKDINLVIALVGKAMEVATSIKENPKDPPLKADQILERLEKVGPIMERIRQYNADLRQWGNEQYLKANR